MYAEYDEHEVLHREPIELVLLLHGKAIEKLSLAQTLTGDSRIRERNRAIARAAEVVMELQGSLDADRGGEIAANLERLYEYIQGRIAAGLAARADAPLAEAAGLLRTLAEGWREASNALKAPAPVPREPELAAAGRAWSL